MLKFNNNFGKRISFHTSNIGSTRKRNEDYVYSGTNSVLDIIAIACDGVGSLEGSDIASEIVCQTFVSSFFNLEYLKKPVNEWFEKNIMNAKKMMLNHIQKNPFHHQMSTTLVLSLLIKNLVYIFWIGDSRAYLIDKKASKQVTVDHNLLNFLITSGTPETQIQSYGKQLASITHFINCDFSNKQEYDFEIIKYKKNSIIFLATDGFYNFFDVNQIYKLITTNLNNEKNSEVMVEQAIKKGSNDNISFAYFALFKE